jgi:hypothetical protein
MEPYPINGASLFNLLRSKKGDGIPLFVHLSIRRLSKSAWPGFASMTESVIGNFSESFRHLIPPEKVQAFPHAQAYGLKQAP